MKKKSRRSLRKLELQKATVKDLHVRSKLRAGASPSHEDPCSDFCPTHRVCKVATGLLTAANFCLSPY